MKTFTLRIISLCLLMLAVYATTRALIRALPGDPLETIMAETGTTLNAEVLRKELGLDRPFVSSLITDLSGVFHGDWGQSIHSRQPIAPLLWERFLNTAKLALAALLIGIPLSLLMGLKAAATPQGLVDRFCSLYGAAVAALPTPWIGPILLILLAVWMPIFPVGNHIALPALTLALSFSGLWARLLRERVRESLKRGAAPGARARGIPEWRVILKYGLAPVSGPLAAYLGTQIGFLLTGAFVSEVIFHWQGMGTLMVESVLRRDYPLIEATTFLAAFTCLMGNALGDLLQTVLEPRNMGTSP